MHRNAFGLSKLIKYTETCKTQRCLSLITAMQVRNDPGSENQPQKLTTELCSAVDEKGDDVG